MPRPKWLSYALNKKTDKLLKANRKRRMDLALMVPVGTLAFLLWWYFLSNMDRMLDGWISLFSSASNSILTPLEAFYFQVLFITTIAFGLVYAIWHKHNEKYKKYKEEVLRILTVEPCEHKSHCTCKDDYCYWIEKEEHIDLI